MLGALPVCALLLALPSSPPPGDAEARETEEGARAAVRSLTHERQEAEAKFYERAEKPPLSPRYPLPPAPRRHRPRILRLPAAHPADPPSATLLPAALAAAPLSEAPTVEVLPLPPPPLIQLTQLPQGAPASLDFSATPVITQSAGLRWTGWKYLALAAGTGALGVGIGFGVAADGTRTQLLTQLHAQPSAQQLYDRASTFELAANIAYVSAAAFGLIAGALWITDPRPSKP